MSGMSAQAPPISTCSGCGQTCIADASWTVRGFGECCRPPNEPAKPEPLFTDTAQLEGQSWLDC